MERIPKIVTQRLQRTAKETVHPDAGLLTAFVERSLAERERSRILDHLAQCANCREVVSLALPETPAENGIRPRFSKSWLGWPTLRWAALTACLVMVGGVVVGHYTRQEKLATFSVSSSALPPKPSDELVSKSENPDSQHVAAVDKIQSPSSPRSEDNLKAESFAKSATVQPRAGRGSGAFASGGPRKNKNEDAFAFAKGPSSGLQKAPVASEAVEVAAAPAPSSPAAKPTSEEGNANDTSRIEAPSVTNEVVNVDGAAPVVQTETAAVQTQTAQLSRGKAKDANVVPGSKNEELAFQGRDFTQLTGLAPTARWTLSHSGAVERSLDEGRTWQVVPVADRVTFRAVSVLGGEIWVGGAGGALYHSSDNGQSWVQVKLSKDGVPLAADITSLEFKDASNGKLTTIDHQVWNTNDGGVSWQKQ